MFLHIKPQKAIINDINSELITTYKVIKNNVNKLIELLDSYKEKHSKEFFYKIRDELFEDKIEIAARFIYLNKTCFNGIYRVNSEGFFNVPPNNVLKEKLNLYNKENLLNLNKYFNNNEIKFSNIDYLKSISTAQKGDFVFVDSPYDYEIGVNGFTSYTKGGFNQKNQEELANELINLDKKGVKWMATNHNTELIRELYKDFKIDFMKTNRSINSNGSLRKLTGDEVVIINY